MAADAPRSRRRPPSLRTRLLLILLLALLAVQVLSIGAVGWSRGQGARHLVNGLVARDVLQAGDYQLAPAGSGHRITHTDTGVVIYAHGDLDLQFVR